ncbi:hypothetical protein F5148DRAFT_1202292 [Russula earlei]|uniref:Uncharacterized protein n=1 Tax=Russula earlei TaxID=71964 RepID=A0ACC0U7Y4_9AGAM|nr:hypothetical protein F5148DRAFT_1202292 [Russula earlei]
MRISVFAISCLTIGIASSLAVLGNQSPANQPSSHSHMPNIFSERIKDLHEEAWRNPEKFEELGKKAEKFQMLDDRLQEQIRKSKQESGSGTSKSSDRPTRLLQVLRNSKQGGPSPLLRSGAIRRPNVSPSLGGATATRRSEFWT